MYGIPPALGIHYDSTFWGHCKSDFHVCAEVLGCDYQSQELKHDVKICILSMPAHLRCLNARQYIQSQRATATVPDIPMPEPCGQEPPERHNVFSDGGLINPTKAHWSLNSICWPKRIHEPNAIEHAFAHHSACEGHNNFHATIAGPQYSSTRAELMGALIAKCGPGLNVFCMHYHSPIPNLPPMFGA